MLLFFYSSIFTILILLGCETIIVSMSKLRGCSCYLAPSCLRNLGPVLEYYEILEVPHFGSTSRRKQVYTHPFFKNNAST